MPSSAAIYTEYSAPQLNDYFQLIAQISSSLNEQHIALPRLIQQFSHLINSNRKSTCIQSVSEFVSILEKRGALQPSNVSVLKQVAAFFEFNTFIPAVEAYENRWVFNQNNLYPTQNEPIVNGNFFSTVNSVPSNATNEIPFRVKDEIASKCAKRWKELARHLGLTQGLIDIIEAKHYLDVKSAGHEVLCEFEKRQAGNPVSIRSKLKEALLDTRRTDLAKFVDNNWY